MKHFLLSLSLALYAFSSVAAEPTAESIETLLTVTRAESMIESLYGNLEQNMRQGMQQAAAGKTLTDEQQRLIQIAPRQFVEVMRQEFNWSTLKPIYVGIYRESFSQEEIDGLVAFYRSPAGQAFVNKMPVVTQKSMAAVQAMLGPLGQKMKAAMDRALAEAKLPR